MKKLFVLTSLCLTLASISSFAITNKSGNFFTITNKSANFKNNHSNKYSQSLTSKRTYTSCTTWQQCVKVKTCLDIADQMKSQYGGGSVFQCIGFFTKCCYAGSTRSSKLRC